MTMPESTLDIPRVTSNILLGGTPTPEQVDAMRSVIAEARTVAGRKRNCGKLKDAIAALDVVVAKEHEPYMWMPKRLWKMLYRD